MEPDARHRPKLRQPQPSPSHQLTVVELPSQKLRGPAKPAGPFFIHKSVCRKLETEDRNDGQAAPDCEGHRTPGLHRD